MSVTDAPDRSTPKAPGAKAHGGPVPKPPVSCRNCGSPLTGRYCAACGQEAAEPRLSLRAFLGDLLEHFVSFDSRAWRTLIPLLFRPGHVTARYLEGQRARFVPPVRLYLFVSLLYFLLLSWTGPGLGLGPDAFQVSTREVDESGEQVGVADAVRQELEEAGLADIGFFEAIPRSLERITENPQGFRRSLVQGGSYLMFLLLPAFAFILKLLYLGRRRYFLEHLLFAVHYHVFVFLVLGVRVLLDRPATGGPLHAFGELLVLTIPIYLLFGLRRVYGGSWIGAAFRTVAVGTIYGLILAVSIVALVAFLVASWGSG